MTDMTHVADAALASLGARPTHGDALRPHGVYTVECRDADGALLWTDTIVNLLTTAGKNLLLDSGISTTSYVGLISSTSFSAVSATDTLASHAGWLEAGSTNAPPFAARLSPTWAAASGGAKTFSAQPQFTMTGDGTVQGLFIVAGSGAAATLLSTTGTLLSAGVFSGGAQPVISGNTLGVSYTLTLN